MSLPVIAAATKVRPSRTGKWRALVLVLVHLVIAAHLAHWLIAGKTISPLEPSEAMYTLNHGHLNAGFVLFAASILVTALFGRFFCGWGCHIVALQDLCAWFMKKLGVKPKPFRSRYLVLAPLALAIYMFVWPTAYRLYYGVAAPPLVNGLMATDFWKTFPGLTMAIFTFAVCGFAIVYFLGAKGFCTYGCPYGGFYGLVDPVAVGRIRVTDACEHCGHCTAVCTSNVKVHEEVALYGMVVDPGCMKCMDCVSVCPNDALYWGLGKPALRAKPKSPRHPVPYDYTRIEELAVVVIGFVLLSIYRGLYGHVPLLAAMGMAAIVAFLILKLVHLFKRSNVRLQNLTLRHGGRLTRSGMVFMVGMVAWLGFTAHSAAVQWQGHSGKRLVASLNLGDELWSRNSNWWAGASPESRTVVDQAIARLERAERWGLLSTDNHLDALVRLYLARQDEARAEQIVRRMVEQYPRNHYPRQLLGRMHEKLGRVAEAEGAYRQSIELNPAYDGSRRDLCWLLLQSNRWDDAVAVLSEHVLLPTDAQWVLELGEAMTKAGLFIHAERTFTLFVQAVPRHARAHWLSGVAKARAGRLDESLPSFRRAIDLSPDLAEAHADLGNVLLQQSKHDEAIKHLQRAIALKPDLPRPHFDLGVSAFMQGKLEQALPYVREAIRISPNEPTFHLAAATILLELDRASEAEPFAREIVRLDPRNPQAFDLLGQVLAKTGDRDGAQKAFETAQRLSQPPR